MIVKQKAKAGCTGCYYIHNCPVDTKITALNEGVTDSRTRTANIKKAVEEAECTVEDYIWVDKSSEQFTSN